MKRESIFKNYEEFLQGVNEITLTLGKIHKSHILCKAGCSACCQHLTLLPIEWHYLKYRLALSSKISRANTLNNEACPFLCRDMCQIYEFRPLICRTHGLPLLYLNDDFRWELSHCPLNFTSVTERDYESLVTPENCLNMEDLNKELARLNSSFIKTKAGEKISPASRLPMNSLFS